MTDKELIYDLLGQTLQAYHPFYREDILKWQQEIDLPDNWFSLNAVRANEPGALTLEEVHLIAPYASIELQRERHDGLVEAGCLVKDGDDSYRLTERGRDVIEGFFRVAHVGMGQSEPLPLDELEQLRGFLERLVTATLNAPEPAVKPVLEGSRWTDPGPDVAPSIAIDQLVTDLLRFRDDAHLATWQPYGIDGRSWEAFTSIWREEAQSAAALVERLPNRGYSEDEYAAALKGLEARGWISAGADTYQVSDEGRRIREQAEVDTDRIYYAPWSVLDEKELAQLDGLLNRTVESLNKRATEQFWPLAVEVAQAIFPVTRDFVQSAIQEHFEDASIFFPILLAIGNEPEPFSAKAYRRRTPYINAGQIDLRFKVGVSEGMLADAGNGSYSVTDAGKAAVTAVNDLFYTNLGEIDPQTEESAELADFLQRLVDASLEAEEPAEKWAVINMHHCHPGKEYAPLARIDQHLDDLNAFRDDAHNAAWQKYEIDGHTREAMTFIWRGDATSAAELTEKLSFRGYSEEDYTQSLADLDSRGWISLGQEGYQATPDGNRIRQGVEETTNRIFYAPWNSLDGGEQFRLRDLLIRLKLGLKDLDDSEGS